MIDVICALLPSRTHRSLFSFLIIMDAFICRTFLFYVIRSMHVGTLLHPSALRLGLEKQPEQVQYRGSYSSSTRERTHRRYHLRTGLVKPEAPSIVYHIQNKYKTLIFSPFYFLVSIHETLTLSIMWQQ